jgi:hypothetical protein
MSSRGIKSFETGDTASIYIAHAPVSTGIESVHRFGCHLQCTDVESQSIYLEPRTSLGEDFCRIKMNSDKTISYPLSKGCHLIYHNSKLLQLTMHGMMVEKLNPRLV